MQIVGYETAPGALVLADTGSVRRVSLDATRRLSYALGERRCAGVVDDGTHLECDRQSVPRCERHTETWVCARCTGTCLKDRMDCHEDHAVYLAAFASDTFKVGVTREARLERRLREQGADRGAHLRTVSDGRIAREMEADIAAANPEISDRVRVPAKLQGLHRRVDEATWRDRLDGFDPLGTYSFDHGLDLSTRPVRETFAAGTVRATKGRLLVLARGGDSYAVDLRDLVGHEVREVREGTADLDPAPSPDRQASLGSFG